MAINEWSTTASNNATGVTNVNWAEGQAPSTVNDSARNLMADVATWYGQASGKIPEYLTSTSGTNTITATGPAAMSAYAAGQRFSFIPAATNTGATTINITPSGASALGAKNIFSDGAACIGGELKINVPTVILYDGTQFNIIGPSNAKSGSSLVLVDTKTASTSAALNFTSGIDSSADEWEIHVVNLIPATNATNLILQVSEDGGSNYKAGASDYSYYANSYNSGGAANAISSAGATFIQLTAVTLSNTADGWQGVIRFWLPSGATYRKSFMYDGIYLDSAGPNRSRIFGGGTYIGTANAITAFRLQMGAGNITSGSAYLYKVRKG